MKQKYHFVGQMPILFTTCNSDGSIDTISQNSLTDIMLNTSPAAIGHLGGASDYHKLSQKDRDICISTLVEHVNGRCPVFIGNTALSLRQSVENAKRAEQLGADLLMTCSPIFGSANAEQLFDYYSMLCDAVSIPIIVQDTGASSSVYTPEFMNRLSYLPNVGYAKCEGSNFLVYTQRTKQLVEDRMQIIGGAGGNGMIQLLRLGIEAFMTGTEAPEIHSEVIRRYLAGDVDIAEEIFNNCVAPYLFLYTLKPRTSALTHLAKRGAIQEPHLQWPNEEGQPAEILISEFERVMEKCYRNLEHYKA